MITRDTKVWIVQHWSSSFILVGKIMDTFMNGLFHDTFKNTTSGFLAQQCRSIHVIVKNRFFIYHPLTYDSVFGKRVLTYWEHRGNLNYHQMNVFTVAMENYIYFWKEENLTFPKMYSFPRILWRHSCGCNLDFPYFLKISQYVSTLFPNTVSNVYSSGLNVQMFFQTFRTFRCFNPFDYITFPWLHDKSNIRCKSSVELIIRPATF